MSVAAAGAIPLVDLKAQYRALKPEMDAAIIAAVEGGAFILGPQVEAFEAAFAKYLGVRHFVCCQSGTSAITLMLRAAGVGPGDEVVTTPLTFFASVEGILEAGAVPVFADVDAGTLNLDPKAVAEVLTPRTRAILPVHLYGQPADMDALSALAAQKGLLLLEDAAQAAGSRHHGKRAGALGKAASFSFYPGKNLGAYGDAGGVATDDDAIALALKRLRNHGSDKKNFHLVAAGNERLETIQGAVLGVKLPHLDAWNAARRRHAAAYRAALAGAPGLSFVAEAAGMESNYHLFVVRHAERDALLARLHAEKVMADIHYPVCCHLQPALGARRGEPGRFPVAEKAVGEILSLPMYPELTSAQIERVASVVRAFTGA
ncbi:MAG: DegT/DnrJ/EryC1/StrS family aminotransferase [Elusimicrobiota bacterium]|nr:DegT/DnrJ/EryC1/StrS family aminotransferase [Elusimicrobiota bacterium]